MLTTQPTAEQMYAAYLQNGAKGNLDFNSFMEMRSAAIARHSTRAQVVQTPDCMFVAKTAIDPAEAGRLNEVFSHQTA